MNIMGSIGLVSFVLFWDHFNLKTGVPSSALGNTLISLFFGVFFFKSSVSLVLFLSEE